MGIGLLEEEAICEMIPKFTPSRDHRAFKNSPSAHSPKTPHAVQSPSKNPCLTKPKDFDWADFECDLQPDTRQRRNGVTHRMFREKATEDKSLNSTENDARAFRNILIKNISFGDDSNKIKIERIQKMKARKEIQIFKCSNTIKTGTMEAYRKYYYGEDGKLTKRNDTPKSQPRKIKFGSPKDDFQQGPLEHFLFTGIHNVNKITKNLQAKTEKNKESCQEINFLESLQEADQSSSKKLERGNIDSKNSKSNKEVKLILLTLHNIELITRRLKAYQKQKGCFKYDNSIDIPLPARIEMNDRIKMDKQLNNFLKLASEKLKQNKPLRHIYQLDGTPIFSLPEIESGSLVFISHSPYFSKIIGESSKYLGQKPGSNTSFKGSKSSGKLSSSANKICSTKLNPHYPQSFWAQMEEIRDDVHKRFYRPIPDEVIDRLNTILKRKIPKRKSTEIPKSMTKRNSIKNRLDNEGSGAELRHNVSMDITIGLKARIKAGLARAKRQRFSKEFGGSDSKTNRLNNTLKNYSDIKHKRRRKLDMYFNKFAHEEGNSPVVPQKKTSKESTGIRFVPTSTNVSLSTPRFRKTGRVVNFHDRFC
ncbi:unnamed protein product [Moneuplotes crassus]|uniref:Uncharacterized protein n=1 Tax=Euplotes crassus TaxID=5936 RepID=A0AAD1U7Y0_EUPCR|nr:unnamed protein product [Moneuplotes crassus]